MGKLFSTMSMNQKLKLLHAIYIGSKYYMTPLNINSDVKVVVKYELRTFI